MTLRHDAKICRQKASSEQIRLSLGLLTPTERQAQADAEQARRLKAQKKTQQGMALGLKEE
jgi:hypothetical protein